MDYIPILHRVENMLCFASCMFSLKQGATGPLRCSWSLGTGDCKHGPFECIHAYNIFDQHFNASTYLLYSRPLSLYYDNCQIKYRCDARPLHKKWTQTLPSG